jgi:hypothetical protein
MPKDQDIKAPAESAAESAAEVPVEASVEAPIEAVPTDAEIEAAAERLDPNWLKGSSRQHATAPGGHLIVQNLPHGRAHAVSVEIKRAPKRRSEPR